MTELVPWLVAVIGALIGLLGLGVGRRAKQSEDVQRKRVDAILKAKRVRDDVQTLDDDRIIAEFERLHSDKRR